jgi:hypothetical protein
LLLLLPLASDYFHFERERNAVRSSEQHNDIDIFLLSSSENASEKKKDASREKYEDVRKS